MGNLFAELSQRNDVACAVALDEQLGPDQRALGPAEIAATKLR